MSDCLKSEFYEAWFTCAEADLPASFFVITACNPNGITQENTLNEAANAQLLKNIQALGYTPFPVTGGSRDMKHAEHAPDDEEE